jgi:hypothetical protein
VDVLPFHLEQIDQHALSDTVLAHDAHRCLAATLGEGEGTVVSDDNKPIAFHASHGLRDSRTALA